MGNIHNEPEGRFVKEKLMLNIDTDTMMIELTRGDSASIVFSAVDGDGTAWTPTTGDILTFAVAKKFGSEPIMKKANEYDGVDSDAFWTIVIETDDWLDEEGNDVFKFKDYVWDCQITTSTGSDTIIGQTDDITPTFRVWGEVAEE